MLSIRLKSPHGIWLRSFKRSSKWEHCKQNLSSNEPWTHPLEHLALNTRAAPLLSTSSVALKLDRIALQASSASIDPAQAASVARGFEALFINELYKTMRQAMLDSSQDDADLSFGADILQTIGGWGACRTAPLAVAKASVLRRWCTAT